MHGRWEPGRRKALQKNAQERRQDALWQEQVLDEQRARAIQLARAKRDEEQANHVKRPREGRQIAANRARRRSSAQK